MTPQDAWWHPVRQALGRHPAGAPTHDVLDLMAGLVPPASEMEALDALVGWVEAGLLVTRSDHGTVYFLLAPVARS